ncbi:hypothetical protein QY482_27995 [Klebsiella pneumoniae]|nr:hypothetical protein [Klebsiella pneumoniae]WKG19003.1 hypothetical protein QY482_27995 [Klebsiella pneumoniae]
MTSNQLTEQQIDLLIENGYDIAHTLENLAENEINSDCFEVFSYSENGRETEWDGKITEFAQRAAKAIRHLTDATTALQAELQERRKADSEPVAVIDLANLDYLLSGADADVWPPEREEMGDVLLYRHAQPGVPDGLVKAVEFYEQVKRENPPVETGAWKDAVDWVLKEACRAAILQTKSLTGNSPVIPDGYVMVPKEPTEAMMLHNSGCQHHAWDDPDCAMRQTRRLIWSHMLAAAPQEVK